MVDDAEENREKEEHAAVLIQKCWRGAFTRQKTKYYHVNAITIQKTWRMYASKQLVRVLREQKRTNERKAFYDHQATIIQKTWRGYFARSQTFDFYKQQKFLTEQAMKNAEMAQMLENYHAETNEYMEDQVYQQNLRYQERFADKNHHLLSTYSISSVFRGNSSREPENAPLIEKYIRSYNKAKLVIPSITTKV